MDHLGYLSPPEDSRPDVDELYEVVKRHHAEERQRRAADRREVPEVAEAAEVDPQHKGLLPRLRPYQKEAVRWMVAREREPNMLDSGTGNLNR